MTDEEIRKQRFKCPYRTSENVCERYSEYYPLHNLYYDKQMCNETNMKCFWTRNMKKTI